LFRAKARTEQLRHPIGGLLLRRRTWCGSYNDGKIEIQAHSILIVLNLIKNDEGTRKEE